MRERQAVKSVNKMLLSSKKSPPYLVHTDLDRCASDPFHAARCKDGRGNCHKRDEEAG